MHVKLLKTPPQQNQTVFTDSDDEKCMVTDCSEEYTARQQVASAFQPKISVKKEAHILKVNKVSARMRLDRSFKAH